MHAMLTLDLAKNVSIEKQERFHAHLKGSRWVKAKVSSTWLMSFKEGRAESKIITEVKNDVEAAAKYSGVTAFDAVVSIGKSEPFSLTRK
jgi:hypothetical protein